MTKRVPFVCIHNSGQSQMAEAFLKQLGRDRFDAHSAGIAPGKLNPVVVEAMKDTNIDISRNRTKSVFDLFKQGSLFHYVITVCDEASAEKCPVFPGVTNRFHWSFPDPSAAQGTPEEKLTRTKAIRNEIRRKIEEFIRQG